MAPTGFALEGLRDGKRAYEKTTDEPATQPKNYIKPSGLQRLKDEHGFLLTRERCAVTEVVAWAASNGDRSENADYQYGKRRLRQIDGRIRFLTKRIEAAEVVDPETPRAGQAATRAFFGATVRYANGAGAERVVSIVGTDEVDLNRNHISWASPPGARVDDGAGGSGSPWQPPNDGLRNIIVPGRITRNHVRVRYAEVQAIRQCVGKLPLIGDFIEDPLLKSGRSGY